MSEPSTTARIAAPSTAAQVSTSESSASSAPPKVTAIIATRDRPELLSRAIESILGQRYAGDIELLVVFDQAPPRSELAQEGDTRRVRVLTNSRAPGLAGARNTGILAATGELIGFCDDDDTWVDDKLDRQVPAMLAAGAVAAVGGIRIRFGDHTRDRCPPDGTLHATDLSRSRVTGAHPSTYLLRRASLLGPLGLVDEAIPYGYGEDYDLLLRAVRVGPVVVVAGVLAHVLWHPGSYFSRRWEAMVDGLGYLLGKHPELAADRHGLSWVQGQRAFALAAAGRRREAVTTALTSMRHNPRELRGPLALLVAARVVSADAVLRRLNARGRGI